MTTTQTTCPGCFDENCYDCNENPEINPVTGTTGWQGRPSTIHGRRTNLASPKQVDYLNSLLAKHPAYRDVENLWPENVAKLSKSDASKLIDELRNRKPEGKTTGATDKQAAFIRKLGAEKGLTDEAIETVLAALQNPGDASRAIDTLKAAPKVGPASEPKDELQDAIYKIDGEIRKVYHTQAGHQVAKVWQDGEWEYVGKRGLRGLTDEHRMTLEEAKEFGAIYGICCNCSRRLTDEVSIEEGIGPVCAKRFA